ncbi:MAG: HlyD family efflux transporter periplasmic adaptor subunit [Candidatus Aminicenantes bacterium]|nr:HlyD family efflux transporter periplasmic adaptor subunit [Candidatus Aminicenantes bacterium]NIM83880.1 HlyD family efflux transporter periplasmic adaptor subunit [Candidatus Aminicenantes bacterium]NIN23344.1 HlyD family efflux transporter periplasmic adaptor subunit [Candidatus Aminicenantes bacterium]NIN47046.1 HlyD family efflux transporter periplasmic adaptor subunit [Candidatus Aminicenantes bacterium]NIN89970.1 HlyD family efflux transporter periplasmic adaptor subunit [Candidatus A
MKRFNYEQNQKGQWLALVIILVTIYGCGGAGKSSMAFMTVQKGTFEVVIPGFGELQAVKSTPVAVPTQVRGSQTIAWLAPENTLVKKGDTVIRFDSVWYHERIQREEYNIAKMDLEIKQKKRELEKEKSELKGQLGITAVEKEMAELYAARDETLYSRNKIIEDAIDLDYLKVKSRHYEQKKAKLEQKARAELQVLELKRRTSQVKVDQYKEALESLEIKAPHDGLFIYEKNWRGEKPRLGMSVWRGMKLGKLPDLSRMEAKVFVLESEAAGLKADLPASVILDAAPGKTFHGKVTTIDSIAKPLEKKSPLKYFEIKVSIDTIDLELMKPGNQVKAFIFVQREQDVISVPNQALVFEKDRAFVNVKNSSGVEERKVEIGARSLTRTVITRGLEEGETILLGSLQDREAGG